MTTGCLPTGFGKRAIAFAIPPFGVFSKISILWKGSLALAHTKAATKQQRSTVGTIYLSEHTVPRTVRELVCKSEIILPHHPTLPIPTISRRGHPRQPRISRAQA